MPNLTSSSAPPPGASLLPPAPPNAATARFLAMIPRGLSQSPQAPVLAPYRLHAAEEQATALLSRLDEAKGASWPLQPDASQPLRSPLPTPTVRLQGATVTTRVQAVVQAAEDCGRLHSERARRLYEFLVTAALAQHVAARPEVRATPSRISYFIVVDELPLLLNLSRATIYRALNDLKAGGLIDRRPWYTSSSLASGGTVTAGVIVDVVLTPTQGTAARVRAEYLRQRYRNLDADRHAGRTAWQWMTEVKEARDLAQALEAEAAALVPSSSTIQQINSIKERVTALRQSISLSEINDQINHLLRWTLCSSTSTPVMLTVSARQDAVYRLGDLTTAIPQQRGALIEERAQALCLATGDGARNLGFWRWLLWRMIELEHTQPGCVSALMAALLRLMTDIREWGGQQDAMRPLGSPGALFVARLKASGWWEELRAIKAA